MNKHHLVILIFCAGILWSCGSDIRDDQSVSLPNIIYVLADDLGYGDLTAFNENGKIKTPHLDQMAAEGMMFTDAHTSSSVCTPTRYGILTGRYNWRSRIKKGVLNGYSTALIPGSRSTVASMLKNAGYHTAYIGKWHLGWDWTKDPEGQVDFAKEVTNIPNDLGFDYAYGHSGSLDMAPYVYVENGKSTAIPTDTTVNTGKYSWWRKGLTAPDFVHEDVTPNFFRRGISYVKEQAGSKKPFFLYLPLPSPHTPILPTREWQGKSDLNPYADFTMMIDDYMGQLLAAVKAAGIEENTLIIFTSDNGCSPAAKIQELVEKGHHPSYVYRGHKADIFEGGHRVPFIVRWPKVIKPGTQSNQTICTTDLMATCADIVNYQLKDNEGEDSYSLMQLFRDKPIDGTLREATVHHSINGSFAIRQGDWKLSMCPGSGGWSFPKPNNKAVIDSLPPVQLYNLKNDPGEKVNLQAQNPEKVAKLQALLTRYIEEGRSTPGTPQQNDGEKRWAQLWWMETNKN
ncbi:arylsulfatase [Fulvivirgaceae bacterium BMA12]|uniref:Arylsulfatase n=1 Tax=Agaribacillus aureus TaxID=3051825 RepID=A0ABT8L108_9BACT|nr:arylsulfatase [Fulvivirgaceae bacterium BMA12]